MPPLCKDCGLSYAIHPEERCRGCHEDAIRRDARKQFAKSLGMVDFKRPPKVKKEF